MTDDKKEATTPNPSARTDGGWPLNESSIDIIPHLDQFCNPESEYLSPLTTLSSVPQLLTSTATELLDTQFLIPPPIIDDFLYPGVYLLAGAPKIGKSFLVMQIGYTVATGQMLWNHETRSGDVLYLALEDKYPRLQNRIATMFGVESNDRLHLAVIAEKINGGLEIQLNQFVKSHPDTKLVIVDTLQKVRNDNFDGYSYSSDYDIITSLKHLADEKGICILLIHHTRKQGSNDAFDMVSGTTGLTGAVDGTFVMVKNKRIGSEATLDVCGREQADQQLTLKRNLETLAWDLESIVGENFATPVDPLLDLISAFLSPDNPKWVGHATELVELLGVEMEPHVLTRTLNSLTQQIASDLGIDYRTKRTSQGRMVYLARQK